MTEKSETAQVDRDCFSCKITGSMSLAAIGAFLVYNSLHRTKSMKSPAYRWFLRSLSVGSIFYRIPELIKHKGSQEFVKNSMMQLKIKKKIYSLQ